jgi:NAD(P)-dependent dehydrogenase (short-subunit alcohol dehydrogenase family)
MNVNLNGKTALVTGAARGIGQAIADRLAANGARVAYTDIDADGVSAAAESQAGCIAQIMDVSDEAQVNGVMDQVLRDFGRLDILVNNAGIGDVKHRVNIDEFPADQWERIVKIDLTGVYLVSKAGVKPMIEQGGGRVINIASVLGVVPARLQCAYNAAKAGVVNLTQSMAIELAPQGILVNCVAPGSTMTDATKQLFYSDDGVMSDRAQQMLSHVPLGRPGTPEEIAHAVLFFAAPETSYVTGQTLCVDGGWTAGGFLRDF